LIGGVKVGLAAERPSSGESHLGPAGQPGGAANRRCRSCGGVGRHRVPSWAALGPSARRKHLQAAAARLQARAGDFAERISAETGATIGWGHFNVAFAASLFEEAAALTTQVAGEVIPSDHGAFAMAVRRPAGVVLGIAPWNAPVILGVRAIATPLACGNTVVLKASEVCPATQILIGEV
jgi:acyl-CoA reductase-like NAD-dependent aldehyde dehydrogenase